MEAHVATSAASRIHVSIAHACGVVHCVHGESMGVVSSVNVFRWLGALDVFDGIVTMACFAAMERV